MYKINKKTQAHYITSTTDPVSKHTSLYETVIIIIEIGTVKMN